MNFYRKLYNFLLFLILALMISLILIIINELVKVSSPLNLIINDKYIINILKFTFKEAFFSTLIIILFALPLSRALYRNPKFFAKKLIIKLFNIMFALPTIVLISGLFLVYGSNGWMKYLFLKLGFKYQTLFYGIKSILIAHLLINLPFATNMILESYNTIPNELWRIADQSGLNAKNIFKYIEWPLIKNSLFKASAVIFIICFTSFSVILTLGGNIKNTTLEVAIYQALKIDLNLPVAALLSLVQLVICSGLTIIFSTFNKKVNLTSSIQPSRNLLFKHNKVFDYTLIITVLLMFLLPICAIGIRGMSQEFFSVLISLEFLNALYGSIKISVPSALLSLFLAFIIMNVYYILKVKLKKYKWSLFVINLTNFLLCLPPYLMITGIILSCNNSINIFNYPITITVIINSFITLPLITNMLFAKFNLICKEHLWLKDAFNLSEGHFFRYLVWPAFKRTIAYAFSCALVIFLGNLSITNFIGSNDLLTLPLLLYQKIQLFQSDEAAAIGLHFIMISCIIFWLIDKTAGVKH